MGCDVVLVGASVVDRWRVVASCSAAGALAKAGELRVDRKTLKGLNLKNYAKPKGARATKKTLGYRYDFPKFMT